MVEPEGGIERRWTNERFYTRFDEVLRDNPELHYTHIYGKVEQEHIDLFKFPRFSSYDSFRNARKQWLFGLK